MHDFNNYEEKAVAIAPEGIAAVADWVVIYYTSNKCDIFGATLHPQFIVVETNAINCFQDYILYNLVTSNEKFVVLTLSNDHTLPINNDKRIGFDSEGFIKRTWTPFLINPNILHFFLENLSVKHFKASSIPIGTWYHIPYEEIRTSSKSIYEREPKLLVSDKIHDQTHAQFQDRVMVARACANQMKDICVHLQSKHSRSVLDIKDWAREVSNYQFHLCVHGGGHDTSTKSWETMLLGTIPIIERNALDDAYGQLPVAFVPNMTDFVLHWTNKSEVMKQWLQELGPFYENPTKPDSLYQTFTLKRLKVDYWHRQVVSKIPDYRQGYLLG